MPERDSIVHLIAGGMGGTMGAILTCPLEVVKTRLQSSSMRNVTSTSTTSLVEVRLLPLRPSGLLFTTPEVQWNFNHCPSNAKVVTVNLASRSTVFTCLRMLVEQEGTRALFKGLGPNLVGVAPTRAIYFCTYSSAKAKFNKILPADSSAVHLCSAASAGFVSCTLTNPIWFVKTRLQLSRNQKISAWQCVTQIYSEKGILGFYRGISASYFGISETVINFVIYEAIKARLLRLRQQRSVDCDKVSSGKAENEFVDFMIAGAVSKTIACSLAYPHEVARTRLREENSRYHGFFQTLLSVYRQDGYRGLYRGLGTQLIRQIPNMAVMMTTYEGIVYLLKRYTWSQQASQSAELYDDE